MFEDENLLRPDPPSDPAIRAEWDRRGITEEMLGLFYRPNQALEPADRFPDEYDVAPEIPETARGPKSRTVRSVLAGSCCGWRRKPTSAELHRAMRTAETTDRDRSVLYSFLSEASNQEICLAHAEGAYTWRQLVEKMHVLGITDGALPWYVNGFAKNNG